MQEQLAKIRSKLSTTNQQCENMPDELETIKAVLKGQTVSDTPKS